MNRDFQVPDHIDADALFALAAGELTEVDAGAVNAHLTLCGGCRRLYTGARELQREALRLGDSASSGVDDVTHLRLWKELAPEAAAAAQRVGQRRAWSMVLASGRLRWAAAVVALVSTGLIVYGLRRDPQPACRGSEGAIVGGFAAQRQGRVQNPQPAAGPGSSARLADSLRPTWPPRGKVHGPQPRLRRSRAPRSESSVAMALGLTVPGPATLTPAPGERKLRCGGLLTSGGASVRILRDLPRVALIRLNVGRLGMRVPTLPPGGRVEIVTPDARVRVVGTQFTVQRGFKPQTTVTVSEGVVWVSPTGRNRRTVVLGAGESGTVLGEGAYLKQVQGQLTTALRAGRLQEAARLGRRYLAVISKPARAATMKLRLAGIVARLGRTAEAVKLYQDVMGSAPRAVARQNALAFLARLYERLGKRKKGLEIWRDLARKYPAGLFGVDALMALVRAGCRKEGATPDRYRKQLAKRAGDHRGARALLRRCQPGGGRP